jgi:predicted Zn finger-like uncharacterized protein
MIAGCPKCGARYRVEREKLASGGLRLRCAKCEAVFRVRAQESADTQEATQLSAPPPVVRAPAPALSAQRAAAPPARTAPSAAPTSGDLVLVAIPEADTAKRVADLLAAHGARTALVHDGVEAMLEIQRQLPKAVILAAHLPKMFGFQICELVKRNESLRGTWLVLVGAIHNQERYRRPAGDMYGADAYLETPDLPEAALKLLADGGVALRAPAREPARPIAPPVAPPLPPRPQPAVERRAEAPRPAPQQPPPRPVAPAPDARPADGLEEQRAKAERLARIIVSDIVLYNEQKFAEAVRRGEVLSALEADLAEGRNLFQQRVDARVRGERDYLAEELLRIAKQRGMK